MSQPAVASQLQQWQVLPQPQRYTALYFSDHARLPLKIPATSPFKAAFTVHNVEHQTTAYRYRVLVRSATATPRVMATGSFTLHYDQLYHGEEILYLGTTPGRQAVIIQLEYEGTAIGENTASVQTQTIHHWITVAKAGEQ